METVSGLVKVTLPNYLSGLPIPNTIGGWFRLGCEYISAYMLYICDTLNYAFFAARAHTMIDGFHKCFCLYFLYLRSRMGVTSSPIEIHSSAHICYNTQRKRV